MWRRNIRDLCIGAIPPAGLTNWLYFLMVLAATIIGIGFYRIVNILNQPVLLFDALGLSVFAISRARKAIVFGHNYEVAIILGTVTAVGGGVIRDILLARIPVILKKRSMHRPHLLVQRFMWREIIWVIREKLCRP